MRPTACWTQSHIIHHHHLYIIINKNHHCHVLKTDTFEIIIDPSLSPQNSRKTKKPLKTGSNSGVRDAVCFGFGHKFHPNRKIKKHVV
ncbi:hypothetical protein MTR_7g117515 [Medicago truncatula]|uniref:Uncharacterized protein n=1 Tax=Medicago truncatula TaxID=3880 RepID=A0A072U4N1_MEDTR|nr:hypothetical protein MTR_7g117515 [Medicago truncatula]